MNTVSLPRLKRALFVTGVLLVIATLLLLATVISGLVQLPEKLLATESTEHSVARVAILGCLLAAIGTME